MRQRRIPVSEAGELAAARADRDSRAVQLDWRALGHGCVELVIRNVPEGFAEALAEGAKGWSGKDAMVLRLAYPQQGTIVGDPPIDEQNARKLSAATLSLNRTLREMCS